MPSSPRTPAQSETGERRAQTAILAATEQLLRERPLNELSVSDIIDAAGISRTSFYAYYASKTSVIAEALRRVVDQVMVAVDPFISQPAADVEQPIRASLERWVEVCSLHGALLRAVSEEWPHDEQLRELWFAQMQRVTDRTARVVSAARRHGQAPPGAEPEALAACLMWGYERVLHVSLVGDAQALRSPSEIVEPLTQMMVGGIYGRPMTR